MRRLVLACLASMALYAGLFALVLDRPLTLGAVRERIDANLTRGAAVQGPKLVIIAGSNGPYSHRCEVIETRVGEPCVNAGVAVGIGLDYLFARWEKRLHPGDTVYLPLEEAQYARGQAMAELGPDASIMLRHDRATLAAMPWHRQMAALFTGDLRDVIMSLIEATLVADGFHDPRAAVTGTFNAWGDHVGHTAALGAENQPALAQFVPYHPDGAAVRDGYGTRELAGFLDWAAAHGVHVIGGVPAGFADSPILPDALAAIRTIYRDHGAGFLALPNLSRYPRADFFDTPDHLNEAAQIRHSKAVAAALKPLMAQPEAAVTALGPGPTR
jgi:hypothetical protein